MRWIGLGRGFVVIAATGAVGGAFVAAGCGGSSSGDGDGGKSNPAAQTPAAADAPAGRGSPRTLTANVARLLAEADAKRDCEPVELMNSRSAYQFTCPAKKAFRQSLRKFEITGASTFGSAAVIDYRSGAAPDGALATMFVGPSGEWGISRFGLLYGPTVGTSDKRGREGSKRAVSRYLRAVATRNCKLYRRSAAAFGATPEKGCANDFLRTSAIGAAVAASGGAEPRYLGGNKVVTFYSVTLPKPQPRYFTLSVIEASAKPPTFVVLDASAGPEPEMEEGDPAEERPAPEPPAQQERPRPKPIEEESRPTPAAPTTRSS